MVFGAAQWALPLLSVSLVVIGCFLFVEWRKYLWRRKEFSHEQESLLFGKEFNWHRFLRFFFVTLAVLLLVFVLLDPRWGMIQRTERIEGIDVVLVVDVSQSMLCEDIGESRLQRARQIIFDLMARGGNHRMALVMFAADAYPVVPLTFDYEVISLWLQEANPLMVASQGSNLEKAIEEAMKLFEKDTLSQKVIVLLSDGEDMEHQPLRAATHASRKGIAIVTVGIGTKEGGRIPLRDERGNLTGFLTHDGREVVTHLREDILRGIATKTSGTYLEGTKRVGGVLVNTFEKMRKNPYGKMSYEMMMVQYQIFLVPALLFWLCALLGVSLKKVLVFFLLVIFSSPTPSYTNDAARGTKLYQHQRYEEALKAFQQALVKNPRLLTLRYNIGNTLYQVSEYEKAAKEFVNLTNVKNQELSLRSLYNLGTSLSHFGEREQAARVYQHVLQRIDSRHPLYQKTVENLLYLQRSTQNQSQSFSQRQSQSNNQENANQQRNSSSRDKSQRYQNQDSQALLNLVQQEERKNLQKVLFRGGERQSRYPW